VLVGKLQGYVLKTGQYCEVDTYNGSIGTGECTFTEEGGNTDPQHNG
jgi:hypothetical protein